MQSLHSVLPFHFVDAPPPASPLISPAPSTHLSTHTLKCSQGKRLFSISMNDLGPTPHSSASPSRFQLHSLPTLWLCEQHGSSIQQRVIGSMTAARRQQIGSTVSSTQAM
jgi:hypothetical protein